jgi:hypothetical protein
VHRHGIAYVHADCDRDSGARQDTEELPAAVIIDDMRAGYRQSDAIDAFGSRSGAHALVVDPRRDFVTLTTHPSPPERAKRRAINQLEAMGYQVTLTTPVDDGHRRNFASAAPRWARPCGADYAHIPVGKGQVVF